MLLPWPDVTANLRHKLKRPVSLDKLGVEHGVLFQLDLEPHVLLVFPRDEQAFLVRFLLNRKKEQTKGGAIFKAGCQQISFM